MFSFIGHTLTALNWLFRTSPGTREGAGQPTYENQRKIHEMRLKEEGYRAKLQADIVKLQGDINLQNTIAEDLHRRFEDASPFALPLRTVWPMLFSEYADGHPLLLIAPFWDETQANVINDEGRTQFRVAMSDALRDSAWGGHFNVLDGYFKRPLRQTDMDLRIINDALKDMPVAVVYGTLDQHEIRVDIALWNILPGEAPGKRVYIRGEGRMPRDLVIRDNRQFKQELGRDLAHVVGQVGAIYYLFRHDVQPDVQSFATGDDIRDREVTARFEGYKRLYELYRLTGEEEPPQLANPPGLSSLRTVSTVPRSKLGSPTTTPPTL